MDAETDLSLDQLIEIERLRAEAADRESDHGGTGADDGSILVLPWWQHPVNIVTLVVTAAILAGMVGWMVGDSGSRVEHNDVDTGFLQDMRVHHEQAVAMSFIYRNLDDTDPGLRTIARQIIFGQSIEIGRMVQLLRDFGELEANETDIAMLWMGMASPLDGMPGMATDAQLDELGRLDGRAADELFVRLMSAHHLGGIDMADFAVAGAANDEVVAMAASMASAQRGELGEMSRQLSADG
jgi:uncharacterized protein (DUF305 family)